MLKLKSLPKTLCSSLERWNGLPYALLTGGGERKMVHLAAAAAGEVLGKGFAVVPEYRQIDIAIFRAGFVPPVDEKKLCLHRAIEVKFNYESQNHSARLKEAVPQLKEYCNNECDGFILYMISDCEVHAAEGLFSERPWVEEGGTRYLHHAKRRRKPRTLNEVLSDLDIATRAVSRLHRARVERYVKPSSFVFNRPLSGGLALKGWLACTLLRVS